MTDLCQIVIYLYLTYYQNFPAMQTSVYKINVGHIKSPIQTRDLD